MLTTVGLFGVGVITMQVRQVARKPQECFANGRLCDCESISHSSVAPCEAASKLLRLHIFSRALCAECICGSISFTSVYITVSLDFLLGWWPLFRLTGLDLSASAIVYCDSFAMVMVEKNKWANQSGKFAVMTWKEEGIAFMQLGWESNAYLR